MVFEPYTAIIIVLVGVVTYMLYKFVSQAASRPSAKVQFALQSSTPPTLPSAPQVTFFAGCRRANRRQGRHS
jgi:hypothetical protein